MRTILSFLLSLGMGLCVLSTQPLPIPEAAPAAQQVVTPEKRPAEGEKIITLTFTGDVTLGGEESNRGKPESFDGYAAREGYGWFFRNMKGLFSTDDLTLVNLEGALTDSAAQEDTRKTFRFRGPVDYARILSESGIDACAISNNHIYDFGRQGFDSTLSALQAQGIRYCGNEYSFVFEQDGIRIGFFALGSMYFYNYEELVGREIARLRREGVNAIVCSFHAGQEYSPRRRDRDQEAFARRAIQQWGADLVIMHHPHVLQGVDILENRYVFYSLGNFCFGGNMFIRSAKENPRLRTLETAVVQMDLHFSEEGTYLGQSGRVYPCYISSSASEEGDPNDFQPKFVSGDEARAVIARMQEDTRFDLGSLEEAKGCLELPYLAAPGKE